VAYSLPIPLRTGTSLAFDVLIIGTALPNKQMRELSVRGLKTLNADQRGYFKLDSSKTVIDSLEYNGVKVSESVKADLNKSLREIQTSIKFKDIKGIENEAQNLNRIADGLEDVESKNALKAYAKKLMDNPKSAIEIAKASEKYPDQSRNAIENVESLKTAREAELQKLPARQVQVKERPKIEEFPVRDLKKEAEIQAAKDKALEDAIKLEKRKKEIMEELRKQHEEVKVDPENPPTVEENIILRKKVQAEIVKRLEKRLNESLKKSLKEAEQKKIELQKQIKAINKESTQLKNQIKTDPYPSEKTALQNKLQNLTELRLSLKNQTKLAEQTKTSLQTKLKEQTKLSNQTKNQTSSQTKPKEGTSSIRQGGTNKEEDKTKKLIKFKNPKNTDNYIPTSEELKNSTAIKAGAFWWVKLPNGKLKVYPDKGLPSEITDVQNGKGSGFKSVQTVQGKPINTNIKIGFAIAIIRKPSHSPGAAGAVHYSITKRPAMKTTRKGKVIHINGVGDTRKMPKGRIMS
jgi:hypothetical protein